MSAGEPTPPGPPTQGTGKKDGSKLLIFLGAGCGCVVLVGALVAVIGVPAFINYIKRSKAQEARQNLSALSRLVEQECAAESVQGGLAGGVTQNGYIGIVPAGPVPPTPPASSQATGDFASDPGFARVGFAPNPVVFSYSIRPIEGGIELIAQGDLDGDGKLSLYSVSCDDSCHCFSDRMFMEDELE